MRTVTYPLLCLLLAIPCQPRGMTTNGQDAVEKYEVRTTPVFPYKALHISTPTPKTVIIPWRTQK